ncbi:hypothetical protein [Skermanella pratensis]|uniref:hypothetical protein n=1 Tax=Skermanella pratensis TaxID=2233999 RepID=UPI001300EEFB|nr:hypothetical protein [Skermanella pratensis]
MDQELKSLLTILLGKIDDVGTEVGELRGKVDGLSGKVDALSGEVGEMREDMNGMKAAITNLEREQTLTRQILGATNHQMIGRLDQFTMQYETLVGARPSAAE